MKKIKKIMSIGANCIAADITKALGLREPGPVDNLNGFNIWKSHFLFDKGIYKIFFKIPYEKRGATEVEKKNYFYAQNVYRFYRGISIVHNDFESKKFQKSLKQRIKNFYKYYKRSQTDESLWYIYSLNLDDENLTDEYMLQLLPSIPECCKSRLICIGMRGKNDIFEKYFKYYIECGNEEDFEWGNKAQALLFINRLEEKYGLQFEITKEV